MRYLIVFILVFPLMLIARENPFAPAQGVENVQEPEQNATAPEETQTVKPQIHPRRISFEKEVVNYAKARFVFRENSAYIETKDEMINHFSINNPPSIVMDFKSPSDFASKRKDLTVAPFIRLEMGAHGDSYRVVLRLDKKHSYKIDARKYGQLVTILE